LGGKPSPIQNNLRENDMPAEIKDDSKMSFSMNNCTQDNDEAKVSRNKKELMTLAIITFMCC